MLDVGGGTVLVAKLELMCGGGGGFFVNGKQVDFRPGIMKAEALVEMLESA